MKFHYLTKRGNKSCLYEGTIPLFTLYMKESLCRCLLFDKVVHQHSLNKFSNDTDLVNPVTRRAASFLIFSKVCESCSEHPSYAYDGVLTLRENPSTITSLVLLLVLNSYSHE